MLVLAASVAGCSLSHREAAPQPGEASADSDAAKADGARKAPGAVDCRKNRRSCIYKGSYEPDERDYAEKEAQRLNRAEAERLRRAFAR